MRVNAIKLTKENILNQLTKNGFLPEEFKSDRFTADSYSAHANELLSSVRKVRNKKRQECLPPSLPESLSIYKSDLERRQISIPNPEHHLSLAAVMADNWEVIKKICESANSESPITCFYSYEIGDCNSMLSVEREFMNSRAVLEDVGISESKTSSSFKKNKERGLWDSVGYRCRLKIDIANCYMSLYTHSLAWAICGKSESKNAVFGKGGKKKPIHYDIADELDKNTRLQNSNQTNGILVGPYTSRILSEIILASIDRKLSNYVFKRYVDDYSFYFKYEHEAIEAIPEIARILNEFNLSINQSKISIEYFPYSDLIDIRSILKNSFLESGISGMLNQASALYRNGDKGAYKYALKMLKNRELDGKQIEKEAIEQSLPIFVNITITNPKVGRDVLDLLDFFRITSVSSPKAASALQSALNEDICSFVAHGMNEESYLFLQILLQLNLKIEHATFAEIMKKGDDFSRIVLMDIALRHPSILDHGSFPKESLFNLFHYLENESYNGEHWLLLYEISMHNFDELIDYDWQPPEKNCFFNKMSECSISFYNPIDFRQEEC